MILLNDFPHLPTKCNLGLSYYFASLCNEFCFRYYTINLTEFKEAKNRKTLDQIRMADTVTLLDSDEDTPKEAMYKRRKVVTVWPCVNIECKSGQEKEKMVTADQYSCHSMGWR